LHEAVRGVVVGPGLAGIAAARIRGRSAIICIRPAASIVGAACVGSGADDAGTVSSPARLSTLNARANSIVGAACIVAAGCVSSGSSADDAGADDRPARLSTRNAGDAYGA
jgi:hypothetical protein